MTDNIIDFGWLHLIELAANFLQVLGGSGKPTQFIDRKKERERERIDWEGDQTIEEEEQRREEDKTTSAISVIMRSRWLSRVQSKSLRSFFSPKLGSLTCLNSFLFSHAAFPLISFSSSSLRSPPSFVLSTLLSSRMAPKAKDKSGKGEVEKKKEIDPTAPIDVSMFHVLKSATPPTLKHDNEYPEWIWDEALLHPPTLADLRTLREKTGKLSETDQKRYLKLERRRQIKERNEDQKKK